MLAAIEEIAPTLQMAVERGEADFGGISRPGEVTLGEEDPADGEAENASGENAAKPAPAKRRRRRRSKPAAGGADGTAEAA